MKAKVFIKGLDSDREIPDKYYFPIVNCPGDVSVGDIVRFDGKAFYYYPHNFVVTQVWRSLRSSLIGQWWYYLTKGGPPPWGKKIQLEVSSDLDILKKTQVKIVVNTYDLKGNLVEKNTDFFESSVYVIPRIGELFEYKNSFLEVVEVKHRPDWKYSIIITLRLLGLSPGDLS